jgi:ketosteroid isomerase-like protein
MDATATVGAGAIVREFYELLGQGRLEELLRLLDQDAVIREAPGLPYGGDYHGRSGFIDLVKTMYAMVEAAPVGNAEYVDAGDTVVLNARARFTGRRSGRSAETSVIEVATVRDGQIVEIDIYYKDPSAVAAIVETE